MYWAQTAFATRKRPNKHMVSHVCSPRQAETHGFPFSGVPKSSGPTWKHRRAQSFGSKLRHAKPKLWECKKGHKEKPCQDLLHCVQGCCYVRKGWQAASAKRPKSWLAGINGQREVVQAIAWRWLIEKKKQRHEKTKKPKATKERTKERTKQPNRQGGCKQTRTHTHTHTHSSAQTRTPVRPHARMRESKKARSQA